MDDFRLDNKQKVFFFAVIEVIVINIVDIVVKKGSFEILSVSKKSQEQIIIKNNQNASTMFNLTRIIVLLLSLVDR